MVSAGVVRLPVIVSETNGISSEILRFIQDYKPDYIYTIDLDYGLTNSFEITKEDVPTLFFPNATKAVYAKSREKGIFASQIGKYLGLPVVFEKTGYYSEFIDLEIMSIPEIQNFYLEKVKGKGGKIDYLLLTDLNSSESLLAGYIASSGNGYIVPVSSKSFDEIRKSISDAIDNLGSRKLYHKAIGYKKGEPLYLAILGGNESIPHVSIFDPGLEIFNDKDGWWLYSDLGYSDSNGDGFFDLALGRMEGGLGAVSLHMAGDFLPKNQSAILIGEYRYPKFEDLKNFGGGMTQAFMAQMIFDRADISTKRIVERRGIHVENWFNVSEVYNEYNEWVIFFVVKNVLLRLGEMVLSVFVKAWNVVDYSETTMYSLLESDWKSWENVGMHSTPEHLDFIDETLPDKIGSTGVVGYFGVGKTGWTIPKKDRSYVDLISQPYEGGTEIESLTFSGFVYDDHDMSSNSSIKESVIRNGGGILTSSGVIHDPYTMRTSSLFFSSLTSGKPLGQALIDSVNMEPVQAVVGFMLLNQIFNEFGHGADILAYPFLYTKDKVERILFADPAVKPFGKKLTPRKIVYHVGPADSFKAESWIESNYTINGTRIELTNANDYLMEKEKPITPVFVREFILPENAVINWVNVSGSYSLKNVSPVIVYNDSYYSDYTGILVNCIESLGIENVEDLEPRDEEVFSCMESALKPNVTYPYPNNAFWWRENRFLDNRTLVYVFVPAVLYENESYARVLENASVEIDYEAWVEMNVYSSDIHLGENETVSVKLMNLGENASGTLWIFVEGNESFEFEQEIEMEANSTLTKEFSFAPGIGDYEVTVVFDSNNSVGPRYAYFSVEEPPALIVEIPELIVNEGESESFQMSLKNNGSFELENMSISYTGPFDSDFDSNGFDLETGETKFVAGTVTVPDMQAPGNYRLVLHFAYGENVSANLSIQVPARAVPVINEGEQVFAVKPGNSSGKSFSLGNSGNVPLETAISCEGFAGILCDTIHQTLILLPGEQSNFSVNISVPGGYPVGVYSGKIILTGDELSIPRTKEIPLKVSVPNVAYWSVFPPEWICNLPDCTKNFSVTNSLDSNAPLHANISLENLNLVSVQGNISVEPGEGKNLTVSAKITKEGLLSRVYAGNVTLKADGYSEPLEQKINVTLIASGPEFSLEKEFRPDKIRLFWKQFTVPKINHVEIYLNNTGESGIERVNISDEIPDGWKGKKPVLAFVKRNRRIPVKEFSFSSGNGYANFSFDLSKNPLAKGEGLEIHYMIFSQPEFVPAGDIITRVSAEAGNHENIYSRVISSATLDVEYFDPPAWLRWLFILIYRLW
ncbi:MAG: hypothetical protein NTY20_00610 [Candidatus Aenigmarchaeota archaeon]|nr:hypothetical protein [Candidatus Aenigmarchaeota archaeon]